MNKLNLAIKNRVINSILDLAADDGTPKGDRISILNEIRDEIEVALDEIENESDEEDEDENE